MPYKDLQSKQDWERRHRPARMARRRELRRSQTADQKTVPPSVGQYMEGNEETGAALLWFFLATAGVLASWAVIVAVGSFLQRATRNAGNEETSDNEAAKETSFRVERDGDSQGILRDHQLAFDRDRNR